MHELLVGECDGKVEYPSFNLCCQCCIVVQVIGETMASLKLTNAVKQNQLFTDGTSQYQLSFQALIVGVMDDDCMIDPVVLSYCVFMDGKKEETAAHYVLDKAHFNDMFTFIAKQY